MGVEKVRITGGEPLVRKGPDRFYIAILKGSMVPGVYQFDDERRPPGGFRGRAFQGWHGRGSTSASIP